MFLPIDGPALNGAISVTNTPSLVKVGSSNLEERAIITIQPTDGHIYFGYSNSVTSSTGTKIFKNQMISIEAGQELDVWVVADTGQTVDVRITEAG